MKAPGRHGTSPPNPLFSFATPAPRAPLNSASSTAAVMTKSKTENLECAKKGGAKAKKPSGARFTAPPGWIQGDFLPSTVMAGDVENLVADGLMAEGSWRLSEGEIEPEPRGGERVLLLPHVERGFSMPPHPFFRGFLNFSGAQLHHFPPNAISYLAALIAMCECFLGCPPHWVYSSTYSPFGPNVSKKPILVIVRLMSSSFAVVWGFRRGVGVRFRR